MCITYWISAISTFIMMVAIVVTACIARNTLLSSKRIKMEELSNRLLDKWDKGEYNKKIRTVGDFYNNKSDDLKEFLKKGKLKKEELTPIDFTIFDDKFMESLSSMVAIKNFIFKLNFYIKKSKLALEDINLDFKGILILSDEKSMKELYKVLRWGYEYILRWGYEYFNFGDIFTMEDKKDLNNFYTKVAEYKKYSNLIIYIKENDEELIDK